MTGRAALERAGTSLSASGSQRIHFIPIIVSSQLNTGCYSSSFFRKGDQNIKWEKDAVNGFKLFLVCSRA